MTICDHNGESILRFTKWNFSLKNHHILLINGGEYTSERIAKSFSFRFPGNEVGQELHLVPVPGNEVIYLLFIHFTGLSHFFFDRSLRGFSEVNLVENIDSDQ